MGFDLVVVGTSLGGLQATETLLADLPSGFPVAIAIVQHRHKDADATLCKLLRYHSVLPLREPEDKEALVPGTVYLAPANYHLLVEAGNFALSTDAPVSYARPSIDVLFESAADAYAGRVVGIILTGANHDGVQGLKAIKAQGGLVIAQDPTTAECPIMPAAAIAAVEVDWILPLSEIAPLLVKLCQTAAE